MSLDRGHLPDHQRCQLVIGRTALRGLRHPKIIAPRAQPSHQQDRELLNAYNHVQAAVALGLPAPGAGEFVSVRLARRQPHHAEAPSIELDGEHWVVAEDNDPPEMGPLLPDIGPLVR
ncbi:NaeI family type II restriction endonuclease [Microtetraspora malaysiensis]|uniref:NaeI family type II restriction endonuclease n=1 Tax=Microtetraspora malaysiensis TaxID=161358 RepID=A0ABW6SXW0_9ACTN